MAWAGPSFAAPPVPVTFLIQHDYDANIDLFGGGNYMTPDDNLILDSMTAAQGMSKLKRVEIAKENLEKLLNPASLNQLRAPAQMQKQLLLVLYWLCQAYDAEASPQELLEELCRTSDNPPTELQTTLKEVLLYNFHVAQHLGVTSFQAQVKLGQGLAPAIPENDQNATANQMKMFLTRMGKSATFVVNGDVTQIDLPARQKSGLPQAIRYLKGIKNIGFIEFAEKDVVRHPLVKKILNAYAAHEPES